MNKSKILHMYCYTKSRHSNWGASAASYAYQYGVFVMVARLCFIYGPTYTVNDNRVIFQFLNNGLNKQDIVMKSLGEQVRSYLYVSDCVTALFKMLQSGACGEMYNVAYSKSVVSIKQIAETVARNANVHIKFEVPTDNESAGYSKFKNAVQNSDKLQNIGWMPYFTLEEGIIRTIDIKSNK